MTNAIRAKSEATDAAINNLQLELQQLYWDFGKASLSAAAKRLVQGILTVQRETRYAICQVEEIEADNVRLREALKLIAASIPVSKEGQIARKALEG